MRRFNLHAPVFDADSQRERYRWRAASVGDAVGAEQIGARLYELGEGERTHPYHFHHAAEEWLLAVAGSPLLRTPDGEQVLRAGDVVCFPPGPGGAHQVTGPGTVLIFSEQRALDTVEYPDSGKVELRPQGTVFRSADAVDLWEEE